MDSIQSIYSNIPPERIAFISEQKSVTYQDLKNLFERNMVGVNQLRGSCIVINGRKRSEFALLLSLLDGIAKKILFLPLDIDSHLHDRFYSEAEVDFEVYLENDKLKFKLVRGFQYVDSGDRYQTEWIIPTSGTTNIPKLVSHTFTSLTRTAKQNVAKGESFVWGLVFDIYRFSGIQVFLQSLLSGSSLIIPESDFNMSKVLDLLTQYKCNSLSATPSFWRKLLMSEESHKLRLVNITLGGEISDKNILSALKAKFINSNVRHIYASTEVGVGFSVSDGKPGFPYSYVEDGINGIKLKIDRDNILWIKPGSRVQKYVVGDLMFSPDGYIKTGDIVSVKDDRVHFLGRDSGAINVGGNKVQPEEVEEVLMSSDFVRAAYVYAKNSPMMGALVCADVVPVENFIDKKILKSKILVYCRDNLENYKVPALLKIVEDLETTESGKLKR